MHQPIIKRVPILILGIAFLLSTSACGDTKPSKQNVKNLDLQTFLKTVKLPQNLSVSFNASEIKAVDSAGVYKTDILELDPDITAKHLLRKEIIEKKAQAVGMGFQTGNKSFTEYLTVLDGGKSFGKKVDVNGGLYYGIYKDEKPVVEDLSVVISGCVGPPDVNEQLNKCLSRSDFSSSANLSFMNYADALSNVEKQLYEVGFPKLRVVESYSLDLETLKKHCTYYYEENINENEPQNISFSIDNESYLFHFQQLIDNIPIINVSWEWGKGTLTGANGNSMKYPIIDVIYGKDGIVDIRASSMFDIEEAKSIEKKPLIGVVSALQVMFHEYDELLLDKGTRVTSAELCYVAVPEDKSYELIPAWTFSVAKPTVWSDSSNNAEIPFDNYSQYIVNAITGKKMSGMR